MVFSDSTLYRSQFFISIFKMAVRVESKRFLVSASFTGPNRPIPETEVGLSVQPLRWVHAEARSMWKPFFWALGIFLVVLGAETLVVEKFVLSDSRRLPRLVSPTPYGNNNLNTPNFLPAGYQQTKIPAYNREIQTKDWMPWSLLAAGAITIMYTSSLANGSGGTSEK